MDARRSRAALLLALAGESLRCARRATAALALLLLLVLALVLTVVWLGVPVLLLLLERVRVLGEREELRLRVAPPATSHASPSGPAHVRLSQLAATTATQREVCWLLYQGSAGVVLTCASVLECLLHLVLWWLPGPFLLTVHSRCSIGILRPRSAGELVDRVDELTRWRTQNVDSQAAELRRIERDLHDGAQARLVALSLHLGMVDALFDSRPQEARQLIREARQMSSAVLTELRDLARGIYPPVLSERGLGDAVRALAMAIPLPVQVTVALPPRRLPAAVESSAYFAVAETLTNAVKHSGAGHVCVDLRVHGPLLRMSVSDDGDGGADPEAGEGLKGLALRLAAFDGTLAVTSPRGGPTEILMEVPCVSS